MAQYPLSKFIDEFAKAQKNLSNFSPNQNDDALKEAIGLAHADMSRHADGHTPAIKDESVNWLFDYFKAPNTNRFFLSNFDKWHKKACNKYCRYMNQKFKGFKMTVGRAQKVINMTFKYLYCTAAYRGDVENIVDKLHMALDKYTLKWYKDNLVKYGQKGAVPEWSKIKEYNKDYIKIKGAIFKYFKSSDYQDDNGNDLPPFLAEFIIWKKERILEDLGVFNKILNDLPNNEWAIEQSTINSLKQDLLNIEKQL